MEAQPMGPMWAGGFIDVAVTEDGQKQIISCLPDIRNPELEKAGKPTQWYYVPQTVRMAQAGDGGYKFSLIHFLGVQTADDNVGVQGTRETAGGLLSFGATAAPTPGVIEAAEKLLVDKVSAMDQSSRGSLSRYALRFMRPGKGGTQRKVMLQAMPIKSCVTSVSNNTYATDDSGQVVEGGAANPWYWKMQGAGPGATHLSAENAYTAMVGDLPAAILWSSFHGEYSSIYVQQHLMLPVWSIPCQLDIKGEWDRIFQHFSANVKAEGFWTELDIAAETNKLVANGGLEVRMTFDGTTEDPGADAMREEMNKQKALIAQLFLEQAKTVIFEPMPSVEAAKATKGGGPISSLFGFGGAGFALKRRKDETHLDLSYKETQEYRFQQPHVITGTMDGFAAELEKDPKLEKRYFSTVYLDDWSRKITRYGRPIVDWPNSDNPLLDDPIDSVSIEFGYPDAKGSINWTGQMFTAPSDPLAIPAPVGIPTPIAPPGPEGGGTPAEAIPPTPDKQVVGAGTGAQVFVAHITKKKAEDVEKPPDGWEPDVTFVKRTVHFKETPNASESPYVRVFVEQPTVLLDAAGNGTPFKEKEVEVRAADIGLLEVGPIEPSLNLDNENQVIELSLHALGKTAAGQDRPVVGFTYKLSDFTEPRWWKIYTGQPDFVPNFRYQVRVVVKGTLSNPNGEEWTGPWIEDGGNMGLTFRVPLKTDPGVTVGPATNS